MNDRIAYEKRNNDRIKLSKAIMLSSSIIHGFDDSPRIYTIFQNSLHYVIKSSNISHGSLNRMKFHIIMSL